MFLTSISEAETGLHNVDLYGGTVGAIEQMQGAIYNQDDQFTGELLGVAVGAPAPSKFKMYLQSFVAWAKENWWLLAVALVIVYQVFLAEKNKKGGRKY